MVLLLISEPLEFQGPAATPADQEEDEFVELDEYVGAVHDYADYDDEEAEAEDDEDRAEEIMATFELGCPLDLKRIATLCRHAEYNPNVLPALILSLEEELPRHSASQSPTHVMTAGAAASELRLPTRLISSRALFFASGRVALVVQGSHGFTLPEAQREAYKYVTIVRECGFKQVT
jgi:hypothetical protein